MSLVHAQTQLTGFREKLLFNNGVWRRLRFDFLQYRVQGFRGSKSCADSDLFHLNPRALNPES